MTAHKKSAEAAGLLGQRVANEARSLAVRSLVAAVLVAVTIAAMVFAVAAVVLDGGRWLSLPRMVPVVAWLCGVVGAVGVAFAMYRRDRAKLTQAHVAATIEREQSLRTGSLRGALEVQNSGQLGAFAASTIAKKLSAVPVLTPTLTKTLNKSVAGATLFAAVAASLFLFSASSAKEGISALRHPVAAWRGELLPALAFERLPVDVPRGMPYTVTISAQGRSVVTTRIEVAGDIARDSSLAVNAGTGTATLQLGAITAPVTITVADGRSPELIGHIAVADRGWIGDVILHADYPSYLQRSNGALDAVSPIRVPQGTVVRVRALLKGGATDAMLVSDGDTVKLVVSKDSSLVSGTVVASRDMELVWHSSPTEARIGKGGSLPVEVPDPLHFAVVEDMKPRITIVAPRSDSAIGTDGSAAVLLQASDDYGVNDIRLELWKSKQGDDEVNKVVTNVASPGVSVWDGGTTISLASFKLEPGDKLHIVAVATDNSPWKQSSYSAETVLRVPSLSEQRSLARDLADSIASRASQMAEAERQLHQQTVDASRSREMQGSAGNSKAGDSKSQGQKNALSHAAAERAKELGRQQQAMGEKIDSLRRQTQDLEDRLKNAGALDSAMHNRMRDIQRMLRDAMTPEMQKQLQELQQSLDKLNGAEAQKSLEQLSAQQQQMREQLEKSAEMLQRAALEGAMQTLSDEAKDLAKEQKQLAGDLQSKSGDGGKSADSGDPQTVADRTRALERDVDKLAKRLQEAGASKGAEQTRAAQPDVDKAANAMQRAAQQSQGNRSADSTKVGASSGNNQTQQIDPKQKGEQQNIQQDGEQREAKDSSKTSITDKINQAAANLQQRDGDVNKQAGKAGPETPPAGGAGTGGQAQQQRKASGDDPSKSTQQTSQAGQDGTRSGQQGAQQQGSQPRNGEQSSPQGSKGEGSSQGGNQSAAQNAQEAASAMDRASQRLADARESQVNEWKGELSEQLDKSISETQQLARQQAQLEQRMKQEGASAVRGEQGAVQQGVQQAAERLEQAGRSSSLLSQRSQKAMADAQRKVQEATQAVGNSQQMSGQEGAQSAMREATEALNQALGSLVRDRERVNNAQSASGFTEMMEQMRQLAQQQSSLNGQMQGLSMLPGGMQGQQAQQQARVLARQQRDVARTLQDVSDVDATGRTDALAKEAQQIAVQMERQGIDPAVAARQQQLYRRLLDAGRLLEQDERDDQGPREARSGSGQGQGNVVGSASGKNASKFVPPTWNELRGLGPEERRLVIEYFRRINSGSN